MPQTAATTIAREEPWSWDDELKTLRERAPTLPAAARRLVAQVLSSLAEEAGDDLHRAGEIERAFQALVPEIDVADDRRRRAGRRSGVHTSLGRKAGARPVRRAPGPLVPQR